MSTNAKAQAAAKAAAARAAADKAKQIANQNKVARENFKITAKTVKAETKKYGMWANYDNDKQTFMFPMLPEKIKVQYKGKAVSIDIDNLGEVLHKGRTDAAVISFSATFPKVYGSYCACPERYFKKPADCVKWIKQLMNADNPMHFVLTGCPLGVNGYYVITSFIPQEEGGDVGSVSYSIELKQYRTVSVSTVKISKPKKTAKKKQKKQTSGKKRVNNKAKTQTYTIKSGDCLWNIAKRYYGNGAQYTKILNANRSVLDAEARKHGFRDCNGGNRVWPGTKIKIP